MRKQAYGKGLLCLGIALAGEACAVVPEDAVVSQGGATVTVADVDAYMARIPQDKWGGFISSAERIEGMLKNLLRTKELARQAHELKLDQSPEMRAQLLLAQEEILAQVRLKKFSADIKTPDLTQLAKERYTAHKEDYVTPASVTVQHVLIAAGPGKRSEEEAKQLADTVHADALKDPAHFDALVAKYSDDSSKAGNGGRMEDAASSKYVPEFAHAADELSMVKPISEPVKTKFGYHVLKLIDRQPGKQQTFAEVKDKLVDSLRAQYASDQRRNFLNELSNQPLDPKPDVIGALHNRYADMAPPAGESATPTSGGDAAPAR